MRSLRKAASLYPHVSTALRGHFISNNRTPRVSIPVISESAFKQRFLDPSQFLLCRLLMGILAVLATNRPEVVFATVHFFSTKVTVPAG